MARRRFRVLTKASEPPFTREDDGRDLAVDYNVIAEDEAAAREYAIENALARAEQNGHAPYHIVLVEELE